MPHIDRLPHGSAPMLLCSLLAAALTACGGGGGSSAASVSTTATGAGDAAAAAGSAASAPEAPTTVADAGSSTTDGSDAGTTSALAVKTTVVTVPIALDGQTFRVAGTMAVRYGAGNSWVTKDVTDLGTCSAAFFAAAASGSGRSCQVQVSVTTGNGAPVATVGLPTFEDSSFYTFGKVTVQYGGNGRFVTKEVTGRGDCSNAFFGSDPLPGTTKTCLVLASGTGTLAAGSWLPKVNAAKIPGPVPGFATPRVMAANVADPSQVPMASDIGDFREYCDYSHMNYDDPIVSPGTVGSHLHTFLGNTATDRNSTASSIATTGNSTCAGGTLNRTAYWVPSLIDTTDGTPQKPVGALMYYKQNYNYVAATAIRSFPAGLRIVAGNAASTTQQDNSISMTCYRPDGSWTNHRSIPGDCPVGSTLTFAVHFPQCWDGINLDSPDHKSHMAYPTNGCPASHPVALTGISFNVNYKVGANGTSKWRLSSDNYDTALPGGLSSHADWFNGWNTDIMNVWTTRCINAQLDCHALLLGDGRTLY